MKKFCEVSEVEEKMLSPKKNSDKAKSAKRIIEKINTTLKEAEKDGTCAY